MKIKNILWYLLLFISANGFIYFAFSIANRSFNLNKWNANLSSACGFMMFVVTILMVFAFMYNEDQLKKNNQ
jgi:hypothetical protein